MIEESESHEVPVKGPAAESARTGNGAVDAVLERLDELGDAGVDEHVTVFERAHEQLRGALDGPRPS